MGKAANLTDEEMEGLGPEELAALGYDDEDDEIEDDEDLDTSDDQDEDEDDTGDDDSDEEADEDEDEEADEDEEGDDDEPGDDDQGDDDETTDDDQDEEEAAQTDDKPAAEFVPQRQVEPVENYDDQIAAFQEQRDAIEEQYNEGEITVTEYMKQTREVDKQEDSIVRQQQKYEDSVAENKSNAEQRWQWEIDRFYTDTDDKGNEIHAHYKNDPILGAALDSAVKSLANDDEYADLREGKNMRWFLEEADRMVQKRFAPAAPADEGKPPKNQKKSAKAKADRKRIPPDIGGAPAADVNETSNDGEFAYLDKLNGMEFEKALAKLTPEQADRYLKG